MPAGRLLSLGAMGATNSQQHGQPVELDGVQGRCRRDYATNVVLELKRIQVSAGGGGLVLVAVASSYSETSLKSPLFRVVSGHDSRPLLGCLLVAQPSSCRRERPVIVGAIDGEPV